MPRREQANLCCGFCYLVAISIAHKDAPAMMPATIIISKVKCCMNSHEKELSKTISYALRHDPESYGLRLDKDGWVQITDLLQALRKRRREWASLAQEDLASMMANAKKQRFEMLDTRIRALYGHSTAERIEKQPEQPPELLYHGTAPETAELILSDGLKSMARQYVHLSLEVATAREVGRRKHPKPVLLVVHAAEASKNGVAFYHGNESIWLADYVPAKFLSKIVDK